MLFNRSLSIFAAGLAGTLAFESTPNQCPPSGPTLPTPRRPTKHAAVQGAIQAVVSTLQQQVGSFNQTAVSIGVQSIHEDVPFLDFHHSPNMFNPKGTDKVDAGTVYRIGSISKLFTVLAALQLVENNKLSMDDAITKWIPELSDRDDGDAAQHPFDRVRWEDVTVHDVAAHLSGIGGDSEFSVPCAKLRGGCNC